MFKDLQNTFRKILTLPFIFYKNFISPILPKACLYEPTCSVYAKDALLRFGLIRGLILAVTRIFRCNGLFFDGGNDPVPEKFSFKGIAEGYVKFKHRRVEK